MRIPAQVELWYLIIGLKIGKRRGLIDCAQCHHLTRSLSHGGGMQLSVRDMHAESLNQPWLAPMWTGAISQGRQAASKCENEGSLQKEQRPADTVI